MKIYAHRGSSTIWPENTMFAFEQANKYGAEGFETDLRLSGDDEIILSHDDNLARFGLPHVTVSRLRAEEVNQVSISSPDGQFSDKIITLRQLVERFRDKDYIFDCKVTDDRMMHLLQKLLLELKFNKNIWFLTWSAEADHMVERYFPGKSYFPRESIARRWGMLSITGLGRPVEPKHDILALPAYFGGMPVFHKRQVRSLAERGKTFVGYIVNNRKDFERCRACGIEIVLTDRPDLISAWRASEAS